MLWIWLAIILIAFVIEAITTDLVSIWFGVGGLVSLVACFLGLSQTVQIIAFIIVSIICIVVSRPLAKKYLKTNIVHTNYDRVINERGVVLKAITPDHKGEVKVLSTIWSASSLDNYPLNEGDYCKVVAIEGNHLVVEKI